MRSEMAQVRKKIPLSQFDRLKEKLYAAQGLGSLSDKLFLILRDAILTDYLESDHLLPNENQLCQHLAIGRTTLREAYSKLEAMNLITRKKSGTYLNNRQVINAAMPFRQVLEQADIREVMDFRMMLEGEIAALATENASREDISQLEALVEKMKENFTNLVMLSVYDAMFHRQLVACSGNRLLKAVFETVRSHFEEVIYKAFASDETIMLKAVFYHERIIREVKARDSQAAKAAMREHIQCVTDSLLGKG
jgi:GntR family transcriptional repressor for pyruvate dehydrogenase complex